MVQRHWEIEVTGPEPVAVAPTDGRLVTKLEFESGLQGRHFASGAATFILPTLAEAAKFEALARSVGLQTWTREVVKYSPAELMTAPLLVLEVSRAPKGLGGPASGTIFDFSTGCPRCGTGATQVSPLRLRPSDVKKASKTKIMETLSAEILVDEGVSHVLQQAQVSGLELREAVSPGGDPLGWYQLIPHKELPPFASDSQGILVENSCESCHQDGFFNSATEPPEIMYRGIDISNQAEVARTWEHFGNSRLVEPIEQSRLARPLILIKPRVARLFESAGVRGVNFIPVQVVGHQSGQTDLA